MNHPTDGMATEIVVQGIVVPTLWDSVGNPLRVSILTADEGEYRVVPRGMGRRLLSFVTEEIRARVVDQGEGDGDVVKVISFTVVRGGGANTARDSASGRRRSIPGGLPGQEKPRGSHGRKRSS
jgi:hypothetical protein